MKSIKLTLAALALTSLTFGASAAELVNSTPSDQQSAGTISIQAGNSLDSVQDQLSAKADEMGAKSFRIISTAGNNKLHGTAEIYQ